ncbi:MAG: hypothetical protein INR62_08970, partial [Rhodospirillales bacterium]|nr:hypothetical protein [Acetobacter sp.]
MKLKRTTALFGVAFCGLAPCAHAQIANPDNMVSGPPKPPATRAKAHEAELGSLQWMWQYTQPEPNGNAVTLRGDGRFASLLGAAFKQPQAFWGKNVPLSAAIPRFLDRHGEVNSKDNRYITVDGCVPSFCAEHGLLWMDLGLQPPLLIFAAVDWTSQAHTTEEASADYNLWLFPSRQLSADAIPLAFTQAISTWDARLATAHRGVPHIAHALLVEPDGQPFPLNP